MIELGRFALHLGFFLSVYAVLIDLLGLWKKERGLVTSGRNATTACLCCLTIAMVALWVLMFRCDFAVKYVAEHTSKDLPMAYRFSALWAGAAGSLLLWLWMQVGFVVLVFSKTQGPHRGFAAGARAIANLVSVFFLLVLIFDKNPFALSTVAPDDGSGMNPLLQHPAMVLHPPTLFIGYAALIIPFAWAISSLRENRLSKATPFFEQVQSWILWAWMFLTVGIVLGAWWAYEELGWGGYWAWDPVENSSLMPWLTATALLHCSRTYRRNTSIATWLVIMSIVSFSLCIFGTFLTRYGLVSSVHAFPEPGLGILFMVLIAIIWIIVIALFWYSFKHREIAAKDSIASGPKVIILNNWLMVLLTFVVFVGTLFPFFSGLLTEQKITLKPEYFTKITAPGGLLLLFLIGVCPHLLSGRMRSKWRIISMVVSGIIILAAWFIFHKLAIICFIICGFAAVNLTGDFLTRLMKKKAKRPQSLFSHPRLRWYGARIVHIGVVLAFVGIAGSGGYETESQAALKAGDHMTVGGYKLVFEKLRTNHGANFTDLTADISVYDNRVSKEPNSPATFKLSPSKAFYTKSNKPTSEVDIRRTLGGDLYVAIDDVDNSRGIVRLRVLIKPLINWIWIGSSMTIVGTILVLISLYLRKFTIVESEGKSI